MQPAVRLVLITICATVAIALYARRIAHSADSVQFALSWVGRVTGAALAVALLLLAVVTPYTQPRTLAAIASLLATGSAGLIFILDNQQPTKPRFVGLTLVLLWILLIPASTLAPTAQPPSDLPTRSLSAVARERAALRDTLIADSFDCRTLALPVINQATYGCWQFDLTRATLRSAHHRTVDHSGSHRHRYHLRQTPAQPRPSQPLARRPPSRRAARRRRSPRSPPRRHFAFTTDPYWRGYRVCVDSPAATPSSELCLAIAFGRDLPDLVARRNRVADIPVFLRPLTRFDNVPPP